MRSGDVIVEVAGRPVFAVEGRFPAYRDLTEGLSGPDVKQFQRALVRLGYRVSVSGSLDSRTAAAATALYRSRGYSIPQESKSVVVPKNEIGYVPKLPGTIVGGRADVGSSPETMATIAAGRTTFVCVDEGLDRIDSSAKLFLVQGKYRSKVRTVNHGVDDEGTPQLILRPVRELRPRTSILQAEIDSSAEEVLVVPVSAIGGDSIPNVAVVRDGKVERIEVELGLEVDGMIAVTAPPGSELNEGDRVVVSD